MKSFSRLSVVSIGSIFQIICFFFLSTSLTFANPEGGTVASGQATITNSPNTVTVNQSSTTAIIDWHSFNIGSNEHTHFEQPANGVALNRIDPSQGASSIFGKLTSTGRVVLVNQAGFYFSPSAHVDVGSLIASTSDISNQNFLAGKYSFDKRLNFAGSIVNEGTLISAENGLIALVGTAVDNRGRIEANLGQVILGSGNKFTLDFAGDGLINFSVDKQAIQAGKDSSGNVLTSGVSNSGIILANGGKILITAKNVSSVLDHLINIEGAAIADSVQQKNGEIILSAEGEKDISISGDLDVTGYANGQTGGRAIVSAPHITLTSTALIDATGEMGGGEILIGGDRQGAKINSSLSNALTTTILPGAQLQADAEYSGNGGKVIVWSDEDTIFSGKIYAEGGGKSGDGGFVEVSGKKVLHFDGNVNVIANQGKTGTLLLDPENLTIQASGRTTASSEYKFSDRDSLYVATQDNSIITVADLERALANANVWLVTSPLGPQAGDIIVASNISWSSPSTLRLDADRNIIINSGVTIASEQGNLDFWYSGEIINHGTVKLGGWILPL